MGRMLAMIREYIHAVCSFDPWVHDGASGLKVTVPLRRGGVLGTDVREVWRRTGRSAEREQGRIRNRCLALSTQKHEEWMKTFD